MLDHFSTESAAPVDVGIVEGNHSLGERLRRSVDATPGTRCIGVWNTAETGLRKIDAFRPHIVLMDLNPPGMSGIKATALVKRFLPNTQVIIVSTGDDRGRILEALDAGACGFLLKPSISGGNRASGPSAHMPALSEVVRNVTETLLLNPGKTAGKTDSSSLTARETQVAQLVAQGLTNKEISTHLNIGVHTVHGYLKIIFRKLKVRSRTEVAVKQITSPES